MLRAIDVCLPGRWNFDQIRNDFFAPTQWFSISIRRGLWLERANIVVPAPDRRPNRNLRRAAALRSPRALLQERRAKTTRVAVVLSLFLVLLIAALFIGGRSVIEPMLRKAMAQASETHRRGEIVFTMPDGAFCRHLAFDNKTAELSESTIRQCPEARPREAVRAPSGFAWGTH